MKADSLSKPQTVGFFRYCALLPPSCLGLRL